jgi:protein NDRG1
MATVFMTNVPLLRKGDLKSKKDGVVFLTVHDIGSNHMPLAKFCSLPFMDEISSQALFVHVCLPGQDKDSDDFGDDFPTMQVRALCEEMIIILIFDRT